MNWLAWLAIIAVSILGIFQFMHAREKAWNRKHLKYDSAEDWASDQPLEEQP